jgi:hypothetical protein
MKTSAKILALLSLSLVGSGFANEIYKWTDENGNVHYGDRPSDGTEQSQTITIASRRTDAGAVSAAVEARRERDAARADARTAAQEAERAAEEERQAAEEQAKRCDEYRGRLEKYVTSRRLYKLDDSGERVYLDDAEMQQARADLQQRIVENCSN